MLVLVEYVPVDPITGLARLGIVRFVAIACVLWLLAIFIHELAHAVAALVLGFRVTFFRVSWALVVETPAGWALAVLPTKKTLRSGGVGLSTTSSRGLSVRLPLVFSAGALGNFGAAVISMASVWFAVGHWLYVLVVNTGVLMIVGATSLVVEDVAAGAGKQVSDGTWLYSFATKQGRAAELLRYRVAVQPYARAQAGLRATARDVSLEDVETYVVGRETDAFIRFVAGLIACEAGKYEAARRHLDAVLATDPGISEPRQAACYLLALLDAFDGDTRAARLRLGWSPETSDPSGAWSLVEAVLLAAEGKQEGSADALRRWERFLKNGGKRRRFFEGPSIWAREELLRRRETGTQATASLPG